MKKMFKRTTAIAASALMIGQMVPYNVFADQTDGKTNLTIHPYVLSEENYNAAKASGYTPTGKANVDGNWVADAYGEETAGITFDIVEVNTDGSVKADGYHDEGKTVFTGLPNAFYKLVPNREDHTDARFKDAEAFYIHLPAVVNGAALFDVDIYPKLTENNDTNDDSVDPETETVPATDPATTPNKHAIKLKKQLSDSDTWKTGLSAKFEIYYQDTLDNWVDVGEFTTDSDGVIQVDGLPLGTYWAVEQEQPEGYLLDQTPIKFELDGSGEISKQVKTFSNDKKLEVAKEVITEGTGTGLQYKWKITADVPGKKENLLSYTITDKYTDLDITDIAIDGFTQGTDYTITEDTDAGTVTISFTKTGIGKLSGTSLEIIVTSNKAGSGASVANQASIAYKYAYNPNTEDEIPDDIPGIIDPDDDDAYPGVTSFPVDPENPDPKTKDEFTPATITISNYETGKSVELSGGVYEISRCSQHKDSDYSGDVVTLANLAPGEYTIKQLATKSGYYVEEDAAKNTKTIYIDKDGTVYEGTEANHSDTPLANNTVIFYNDKTVEGFDLPFTGSTATIVFTIAGIGVMGGALFFFIFFKKRDKDEEEQENA